MKLKAHFFLQIWALGNDPNNKFFLRFWVTENFFFKCQFLWFRVIRYKKCARIWKKCLLGITHCLDLQKALSIGKLFEMHDSLNFFLFKFKGSKIGKWTFKCFAILIDKKNTFCSEMQKYLDVYFCISDHSDLQKVC